MGARSSLVLIWPPTLALRGCRAVVRFPLLDIARIRLQRILKARDGEILQHLVPAALAQDDDIQ